MSLEPQPASVVRFGTFEVDLRAGELRKHAARIKLQEQSFLVLKVLLARPGKIVAREELRSQIWSEDTFVDFDNSLNTAINKLREALGDSAESPRFIETLPRRGYRFIAPVTGLEDKRTAGTQAPTRRWKFAGSRSSVDCGFSPRWTLLALTASPAAHRERHHRAGRLRQSDRGCCL
jgi:DNA-binding winged helix-turn-helix (wHTH) protein